MNRVMPQFVRVAPLLRVYWLGRLQIYSTAPPPPQLLELLVPSPSGTISIK